MRLIACAAVTALILITPLPLRAQLNRAYVSVERGSDANTCSYGSPCRTIGKAISVLNTDGEAILIDGGGFTPFVVDRAVTIQVPTGIFAGVIAGSDSAIEIVAGSDANVVLRGLSLTGVVDAQTGVTILSARTVSLEHLTISGFARWGVNFSPVVSSDLYVKDSVIRNGGSNGIHLSGASAPDGIVRAIIDDVEIHNFHEPGYLTTGINAYECDVKVTRTLIADAEIGLWAWTATVLVEDGTVANNDTGLLAYTGSTIWLSDSVVSGNDVPYSASGGGVVYTRGNNSFASNGATGATLTPWAAQ